MKTLPAEYKRLRDAQGKLVNPVASESEAIAIIKHASIDAAPQTYMIQRYTVGRNNRQLPAGSTAYMIRVHKRAGGRVQRGSAKQTNRIKFDWSDRVIEFWWLS